MQQKHRMCISFYCLTGQTTNKKPKTTYAHKYELQKKETISSFVSFFSKSYKTQVENHNSQKIFKLTLFCSPEKIAILVIHNSWQ
jgi:hypothetical protein